VDLGNFRNEEQSTDAFSDAKNINSTDPQQRGKRTAFSESTNYRYMLDAVKLTPIQAVDEVLTLHRSEFVVSSFRR